MRSQTVLQPDWGVAFGRAPEIELRVVSERPGGLYILGITHSSVRLGDIFRGVYRYQPRQVVPQDTRLQLAKVMLRVKSIAAFHNQLNRIPAHNTVGIEATGDYMDLLHLLHEECWYDGDGQFHQWAEHVEQATKITLSR